MEKPAHQPPTVVLIMSGICGIRYRGSDLVCWQQVDQLSFLLFLVLLILYLSNRLRLQILTNTPFSTGQISKLNLLRLAFCVQWECDPGQLVDKVLEVESSSSNESCSVVF